MGIIIDGEGVLVPKGYFHYFQTHPATRGYLVGKSSSRLFRYSRPETHPGVSQALGAGARVSVCEPGVREPAIKMDE